MGGAQGYAAFAIASAFPQLKLIVQELASMVTPENIAAIPESLKSRVSFQVHDFFTEQDVQADVYFIRWCMHNWSDKYAIKILRALIPALKPGARVLINDGVLPEPGTAGIVEEKALR
jgi:chemotaxis methyl-accepting protein methylase